MKLLSILTAGLVGAAALAPVAIATPAEAQRVEHRTVVHERTVVRHGPQRRWRTRQVCNNTWRNHHRVRVCRTVRYR